jgi:hypothetical protein
MKRTIRAAAFLSFVAAACAPLSIAQTTTEAEIRQGGTASFPAGPSLQGLAQAPNPANNSSANERGRAAPKPDLVNARRGTLDPTIKALARAATPAAAALTAPNPRAKTVVGPSIRFSGFPGLTHFDSRNASNGNQFSIEPPDQGLAVGNGFVFEAVNDVFAVYDGSTGIQLAGPVAANEFFGLAPAITRTTTPNTFGPILSDPRVYFDHDLQRWFVSIFEEDADAATGNPNGRTHLYLAVSTSAIPLVKYNIFVIDTTDDGSMGTPAHPGCPCLPDQPLIGADRFGFYISTNEFSLFGPGFNGAQIYAMSKVILAQGNLPTVVHFSGLPLAGSTAYSVQPASSLGFKDEPDSGVEYFLSALDFEGTLDNRIALWAMLDTSTLTDFHPTPKLVHTVLDSQVYGMPPAGTVQKPGPIPLGMSLGEPLEQIDSGDDRMQQVVFEDGKLWAALGTIVGTGAGRAGIAYFVVTPGITDAKLTGEVTQQGYVAAPGDDSVLYPSIGVTKSGRAAMTFTLVGPTATPAFLFSDGFYPSMAFTTINSRTGAGKIQLGAAGAAPEDGFTGYKAYGGSGIARWGDYSAAVADTDGSIWMAAEWIPDTPRTQLANWGTFIGQLGR